MREIKFRAWDKGGQKMLDNCLELTETEIIQCVQLRRARKVIWMQFTGLKDKNGKEIYEGDILCWEDFADDEYWAKYEVIIPDIFHTMEHLDDFETDEDTEIIGNIYENEKLICHG